MVAKSPRSLLIRETAARVAAMPLSPTLMRDTVKKVDKCMARLHELQQIVVGGLTPRTSTTYLRTGVRYKEQSFRTKTGIGGQRSSPPPLGKLPPNAEEWRRMSLPAMLLGETMREIVQTSRFTRNVVEALMSKKHEYPRTPRRERRQKMMMQHSELHSRRKREKQYAFLRSSESDAQRAKSRIIFDSSSPRHICNNYIANRVSPRNRPWAKKTVLFPNPLFQPSSPKSPVIAPTNRHKLLIKSLPSSVSKLQVKIKRSESDGLLLKKSPKATTNAAKSRRSFSPSSLAMRLVSPMTKSNAMSGLKQHPLSMSVHRRIQGRI